MKGTHGPVLGKWDKGKNCTRGRFEGADSGFCWIIFNACVQVFGFLSPLYIPPFRVEVKAGRVQIK